MSPLHSVNLSSHRTFECDYLEGASDGISHFWCSARYKMDPRGPPEGAPGHSFEIATSLNIDKGADTSVNWPTDHAFASSLCEQPKKLNNNRLLFLTVSDT